MSFQHTVVSGDTLSQIAQNYGVTVEAIARLNNIANIHRIYVGQTLMMPIYNGPPKYSRSNTRADWYEVLKWEPEYPMWSDNDPGIRIHNCGDDFVLQVTVERYAYQEASLFYYVDVANQSANPLLLLGWGPETQSTGVLVETTRALGVSWFSGSQLHVWYKGRGVGDCGDYFVYEVSSGQAELVEKRHQSCDESGNSDLDKWPLADHLRVPGSAGESSSAVDQMV